MLPVAAFALPLVNLLTVLVWHHDKRRAVIGGRRVPEAILLWLARLGGTPAAFLARRWFRHKTRKQPFSTRLWLIAVVQLGVIIGLAMPALG